MLPVAFEGRRFQLWSYGVSHRHLLLRSNKSEEHASRCEVLFVNVLWLNLPTSLDDLKIELATEEVLLTAAIHCNTANLTGRQVYLIHGRDCAGYVIAGNVAYAEDKGDFDSPSTLLPQ